MTAEQPTAMPFKFRFWLAFSTAFFSVLFAIIAVGAMAAGQGLSGDAETTAEKLRIIITFDIAAAIIMALAATSLWFGYKFFMKTNQLVKRNEA